MTLVDTALSPFELALSSVLVAAHSSLVALGLPAAAGATWAASIAVLVLVVRVALLPLVVRQLRSSRRLAVAAPALQEIRDRYRGARDPKALSQLRAETRQVYADAGASPVGFLPLLLQAPVLLSLFRVLNAVARGHAAGALGPAIVAQLDSATLAGASLTQTLLAGGPAAAVAIVLTLVMAGTLWLARHQQLTGIHRRQRWTARRGRGTPDPLGPARDGDRVGADVPDRPARLPRVHEHAVAGPAAGGHPVVAHAGLTGGAGS